MRAAEALGAAEVLEVEVPAAVLAAAVSAVVLAAAALVAVEPAEAGNLLFLSKVYNYRNPLKIIYFP